MLSVCFAGPRDDWKCLHLADKLKEVIESLIKKGYKTFYDGNKGAFDKICLEILCDIKKTQKDIKIIRVLTYYSHEKEKNYIPQYIDETIFPDLEKVHPKQKYTMRNKWIVNQSDILVCHIPNTYKSGSYNTYKHAKKLGKKIIVL